MKREPPAGDLYRRKKATTSFFREIKGQAELLGEARGTLDLAEGDIPEPQLHGISGYKGGCKALGVGQDPPLIISDLHAAIGYYHASHPQPAASLWGPLSELLENGGKVACSVLSPPETKKWASDFNGGEARISAQHRQGVESNVHLRHLEQRAPLRGIPRGRRSFRPWGTSRRFEPRSALSLDVSRFFRPPSHFQIFELHPAPSRLDGAHSDLLSPGFFQPVEPVSDGPPHQGRVPPMPRHRYPRHQQNRNQRHHGRPPPLPRPQTGHRYGSPLFNWVPFFPGSRERRRIETASFPYLRVIPMMRVPPL